MFSMDKNSKGNNKSCFSSLYHVYKRGARDRNLVWEFTKEQFKELTKQDCWYCGQEPAQMSRVYGKNKPANVYYLYNGVDRMDNAIGYTEANCIPCCGRCNHMKYVLCIEDFISHIRKITRNLGIF